MENLEREESKLLEEGDIVKILLPAELRGRYAIILRCPQSSNGIEFFTLKINNYWNSSENQMKFGRWEGQLWIAVTKTISEIRLRKKFKER